MAGTDHENKVLGQARFAYHILKCLFWIHMHLLQPLILLLLLLL